MMHKSLINARENRRTNHEWTIQRQRTNKAKHTSITTTTDPVCIDVLVKYFLNVIMYQIRVSCNIWMTFTKVIFIFIFILSTRIAKFMCFCRFMLGSIRYNWSIVESGVKHHNPKPITTCMVQDYTDKLW
jgi:hypothetical protein